uniref:Nucleotide-binding alpha-beta plait domain-containing protein n=1 Tax=Tanacetum cinerariifolium TaxID=118510 RepID=A0A6L2J8H2_TANCI|nr:nucleotide-binding alpha-beta plait domain-containing protein [Tanacetum cinerariifolium]
MVNFYSKEDAVLKVSTSIFVTNFPDSFSAKDLFHTCKVYGHVVDSFIPVKRTKGGKRFGFVCFINVFSVDRLVNNLCTIWMDRLKLHANVARFQRLSVNEPKPHVPNLFGGCRRTPDATRAFKGYLAKDRSFASIVEGCKAPLSSDVDSSPTIVLDEDCLNIKELSCSLMGRVKEFSALSNIKNALSGACSWFSTLRQASYEFVNVGRIMWVEVEGVPFRLWSENSFKKIAGKWGELLDIDELENTCYHFKRLCVTTKAKYNVFKNFKITFRGKVYWIRAKEVPGWVPEFLEDSDEESQLEEDVLDVDDGSPEGDIDDKLHELEIGEEPETVAETVFEASEGQNANQSPDPFEIYDLLNKKKNVGSVDQLDESTHDYPPGFTPNIDDVNAEGNGENYRGTTETQGGNPIQVPGSNSHHCPDSNDTDSGCSGHFKQSRMSKKKSRGSILSCLEEMIKVGQTIGDAEVFNDFISNSGLEEVPLGDRYLSDHRPILLRESVVDYGPSPFKFYHHWLEVDRFRKFVEDTWNAAPGHNLNGISNLMLKLKFLKSKIKEWNSTHSHSSKAALTERKSKEQFGIAAPICLQVRMASHSGFIDNFGVSLRMMYSRRLRDMTVYYRFTVSTFPVKIVIRTISSPDHSTSNNEDAFSSNILDYVSTIPDYSLASSGKPNSNASNNSIGKIPLEFSPFYNMKDTQAFYAKELPIPPPVILPPSLVLSQSPISNSQYFFPSEEISPKDTKTSVSPSSSVEIFIAN